MFADVYQTLSTPAVLALVGANPRIFGSDNAPQNTPTPYITWFVVVGDPHVQLSGAPPSDADTIQIDCYAGPDGAAEAQVEQLAQAARAALDDAGIVNRIIINTREPDTGLYRIALQADFIHNR